MMFDSRVDNSPRTPLTSVGGRVNEGDACFQQDMRSPALEPSSSRLLVKPILPSSSSPLSLARFATFSDVANKHKITEFVCLAMETSTGRQLGRFARYVRLLSTAAPPLVAAPLLAPQHTMQSCLPPQQLPQPPRQLLPGAFLPEGGVSAADGVAAYPQGVENSLSSAVPLPDLLQELQQWMASLGLNPGTRDAAGFSELGNFRCGWLVGSGF